MNKEIGQMMGGMMTGMAGGMADGMAKMGEQMGVSESESQEMKQGLKEELKKEDLFLNQEQLRKKATGMGEGVKLVSAEKLTAPEKTGYRA